MRVMIGVLAVSVSWVAVAPAQPTRLRKSPVTISAVAGKIGDDGKQVVKIYLTMKEGVDVYASFSHEFLKFGALKIMVKTKDGKAVSAKFTYPKGIRVKDKNFGDFFVYRGQVTIVAILDRKGIKGPIRLSCRPQGSQNQSMI